LVPASGKLHVNIVADLEKLPKPPVNICFGEKLGTRIEIAETDFMLRRGGNA
jgi:hypothetical protein